MESWITLFTAYGKAKVQLSHILQTELPTIPKDSQLYTLRTIPLTHFIFNKKTYFLSRNTALLNQVPYLTTAINRAIIYFTNIYCEYS